MTWLWIVAFIALWGAWRAEQRLDELESRVDSLETRLAELEPVADFDDFRPDE